MPTITFLGEQPVFPSLGDYFFRAPGSARFENASATFYSKYTISNLTTGFVEGKDRVTGGTVIAYERGRLVNGVEQPTFTVTGLNFNAIEIDNVLAQEPVSFLDVQFYGGNDVFNGSSFGEVIEAKAGNDLVQAGGGNDTIYGGDGNDTLYGEAGNDMMYGGAGNDVYRVTNTGDVVVEAAGGGIDRIETTLTSLTLGAHLENLTFLGTSAADTYRGDGNGLNNLIIGSAVGANILRGFDGNDHLRGGAAGDSLIGGTGNDLLEGLAGNDTLNGGAGNDTMHGGAGNDVYVVDSTGDVVVEAANAGIDRIETTLASGTLGANLEDLTFLGTSAAVTYRGDGNGLNNVIIGSAVGANVLRGLGGNDELRGGAAGDSLIGGAGDDLLEGLAGNDTLNGGAGNDTMHGGAGRDVYVVDSAGDVVIETANAGIDRIETTLASQTLGANVEDLTFLGTDAAVTYRGDGNGLNNVIIGSAVGVNVLRGFGGNDELRGGAAGDTLIGGAGDDTMIGGAGNDLYVVDSVGDVVIEAAGGGQDRINTTLASLELGENIENLTIIGTDTAITYRGIGNSEDNRIIGSAVASSQLRGQDGDDLLRGGAAGDTLNGDLGNDTLEGLAGSDLIRGGRGDDSVLGGRGRDRILGEIGNDTLDGGEASDTVWGGTGNDLILGRGGADSLTGEDGQDTLFGGNGADEIFGGAGADSASGGAGQDRLAGGDGADTLQGAAGNDTLAGDAGNDSLDGGQGIDLLDGGDGDDVLFGGSGADMLVGNIGNDTLYGGIGTDLLYGGDGADTLFGDADNDTLHGGAGEDSLNGGAGADSLLGDNGHDTLDGGAGNDTLEGGAANDLLFGGAGSDSLWGGSGNDTLTGGTGTDTLQGDDGADTLIVLADAPGALPRSGVLDGGIGGDRIQLESWGANRSVDLTATQILSVEGLNFGAPAGGAKSIAVAASQIGIAGLSQRAHITGTAGPSGEDRVRVLMGELTAINLTAWRFADWESAANTPGIDFVEIVGSSGNDTITGTSRTDSILGGAGDDLLIAGAGVDLVYGGDGNDTLVLTAKPGPLFDGEVLDGGAGTDRLRLSNGGIESAAVFNLRQANLAALEIVDFQSVASAGAALLLDADQIGAGLAANTRVGGNTLASGANSVQFLMGTATALDLSAWQFVNWRDGFDVVSIRGGATADSITGSMVGDRIDGQGGNDTLMGMDGDDTMTGGGGNDLLIGGNGVNLLDGGDGDDTLVSDPSVGSASQDSLLGGDGDDRLVLDAAVTGSLESTLDGGNGFDSLVIRAAAPGAWIGLYESSLVSLEELVMEGGAGYRQVNVVSTQIGGGLSSFLTIDNRSSTSIRDLILIEVLPDPEFATGFLDISGWTSQTTPGGASLNISIYSSNRFSQIYGSTFDDYIDVDPYIDVPEYFSESSLIFGGAGNDEIRGGQIGNDVIYGGDGDDVISSAGGSDVVFGDAGNDTIYSGSHDGNISFVDSPDMVFGGAGEDYIFITNIVDGSAYYGGDDADIIEVSATNFQTDGVLLSGDAGADLLIGGYGDDTIIAGQGRDTLYGSLGNDRLLGLDTSTGNNETGAEIDDIMRLFGLIDGITFEDVFGTVPFLFSNAAQELFGGDGNDTMAGGRSGDLMSGGLGDDGIWGAGGDDLIEGNEGNDIIEGGFGNDVIYGGAGFDFMLGGRGSDTLYGGGDANYFVFTEFAESRAGAGNRDVIADFNAEFDIIDISRLSQAGVNHALAYDTGEGIGFLAVGDFDFSREAIDVVIFTEVVAGGVLVRAQHYDVFTAGAPDPGTADTNFEILVEGVSALDPFNFDTGFSFT